MKKILLRFAIAVLLNGCGIYSRYTPVSEVPEGLYGLTDTVMAADSASLGNLSWQEMFTDLHLQELIRIGLQNNTDLQTARLKVKEAEAALMSARLAYIPTFALSPEGTVSSFDRGKAIQTYTLPLTASWEVDIFGNLTNAKRRSKAAYAQSLDYEQAVQTQLIATIVNSYYTLLMLDAQYEISLATEASWKETVAVSRVMKEAGMMNEAGLAQTEAAYYQISASLLDMKEQINQVENAICLLLADVPHSLVRSRLDGQQFPEHFSLGIPVQMLANRPDVRNAEMTLAQAFYTTQGAKAAFYPSVRLNGSAGWTNSGGGMIVNPAKLIATAVGSITEPLFNGRRNVAQLRIAKAQQEEARLAFSQTLLRAGSEVNDALLQYQTATAKSDWYSRQVEALNVAVNSTRLLMKHGSTTYLEVLTAQQTLLNAQLNQVANRFAEIQGLVNLYQALGGGRN